MKLSTCYFTFYDTDFWGSPEPKRGCSMCYGRKEMQISNSQLNRNQSKLHVLSYTHGWFATSHAWILEHRERCLEVGLCSCTNLKKEN